MSKKKAKKKMSKAGIFGIVAVSVLGAGAIAAAAVGGFRIYNRTVGQGNVVATLEAASSTGSVVTFSDGDEKKPLTIAATYTKGLLHELDENDKELEKPWFELGDETAAIQTEADIRAQLGLEGLGFENKEIDKIVDKVVANNAAKESNLYFTFTVDYDVKKSEVTNDMYKMEYFDTIRINYRNNGSDFKYTILANAKNMEEDSPYNLNHGEDLINKVKVHRDIAVVQEDEDTGLSEQNVIFSVASLAGKADNKLEIMSIQFINASGGHKGQYCYIV